MNHENNNKEQKDCPLCETTKEALDILEVDKNSEIKGKKSSRKIKTIFWYLVIIFGLVGGYRLLSDQGQSANISEVTEKNSPQINTLAPDFVSEDVWGNRVALSDFRGKKPVLLVFWATWCGQCAKEMPDLKVFTSRYQDKIQVIAVDSGEPRQTIKDYIQEKDVNFLILLDEQRKIWNQYLVRGTPYHFLIDKTGKIVTIKPGLALKKDLETMLSMIPVE